MCNPSKQTRSSLHSMILNSERLASWRDPKQFKAQQGGNHGNPVSGNHPNEQPPTGTVALKELQWNTYHLPYLPTLTTNGWERTAPESAKNSLKELSKGCNDSQRLNESAKIGKGWSTVFARSQAHVIRPCKFHGCPSRRLPSQMRKTAGSIGSSLT